MARRTVSQALRGEWLKSFARYLKAGRKRAGMTQKRMAESVQVSVQSIQKMEKASFLPSRELAADIGEVFDEPHTAMLAAGYIPFAGWRS